MRSFCFLFCCLGLILVCRTPAYQVRQGNYDKAMRAYASKLRNQPFKHKNLRDLKGLEYSFAAAQSQDSSELVLLFSENKADHWPRINAIHRQIQSRQNELDKISPLKGRGGYQPRFKMVEDIDSQESNSRIHAAAFLYQQAQKLLAITDSIGQRQPARAAYYMLRDLKTNYFPYWENANALLDSAYIAGKTHVLFETSVENTSRDRRDFWKGANLGHSFIKHEWLLFYTDFTARPSFDYRAKCKLVALDIGSESTSSTSRTETKEVEDGYNEVLDSAGRVVSRTVKYKTETITITTYSASRSGSGTVLLELIDEHSGQVVLTKYIEGSHRFDESSETSAPSAPSYGSMVNYVESSIESNLRSVLKKLLLNPSQP